MIICPRDGNTLQARMVSGIEVDVCAHCGGAWFDGFELDKFDDADDAAGEALCALLEEFAERAQVIDVTDGPLVSPVDPTVRMMRRFASPAHRVEVDECPSSGGIWLDAGELATIRSLFGCSGARAEATEKFVEEMLGDAETQIASTASETDMTPEMFARLQRRGATIERMLGWFRPAA